ncbi:Hypothetical predicted protein [Podarcis lilfordi]|uniref:Uncharacterized protein n=1 Tax=Podarcis lilfordi TaxID=74358 RepID=A0AA35KI07_9SAUR|nr:Hypothetical predicted protein [Podarcis lilfordi]
MNVWAFTVLAALQASFQAERRQKIAMFRHVEWALRMSMAEITKESSATLDLWHGKNIPDTSSTHCLDELAWAQRHVCLNPLS